MYRFIKILVIAVVALVVVAYVGLDSWARMGIEAVGSRALGTAVTVSKVSIDVWQGKASVSGLSIANPAGFPEGSAVELNQINSQLFAKSLWQPPLTISEIVVQGGQLNVAVGKDGRTNLQTLADQAKQHSTSQAAAQSPAQGGEQAGLIIQKLSINDVKIAVALPGGMPAFSTSLPPVNMTNLGREGQPMSVAKVMDLIVGVVARSTTNVVPTNILGSSRTLLQQGGESIQKQLDDGVQKIKNLF